MRVEYLARRLSCEHCGGRFVAADRLSRRYTVTEPRSRLLEKAEELLRLSTHRLHPSVVAGWTS